MSAASAMGQGSLVFADPEEGLTAEQRFRLFHVENPEVYTTLLRLALQAKARGRRRIGIKMLFEVARWERFLATSDPDFKLNNNHHSRYARLLMAQEPELAGFFELRELRS